MFKVGGIPEKKRHFKKASAFDILSHQTYLSITRLVVMAQELMLISKERYDRLTKTDNEKAEQTKANWSEKKQFEHNTESTPLQCNTLLFEGRAARLYAYLSKQDKSVIDHNEKGELIIDGKLMEGTHIANIINYLTSETTEKRKPTALKSFVKGLQKLNVPVRLWKAAKKKPPQIGGLFVKRMGRADTLPGVRNNQQKINSWIKY